MSSIFTWRNVIWFITFVEKFRQKHLLGHVGYDSIRHLNCFNWYLLSLVNQPSI
jgi:hypothetical protein